MKKIMMAVSDGGFTTHKKMVKKRSAVQMKLHHSVAISAPQSKKISTAVRFYDK
ncbi:MAG: hypothetical protein Q4E32_08690 [Bacteroidales bacterium]|nr:hypothetical protein [Bacteroidales bacterium]